MNKSLLSPADLKNFFDERGYNSVIPYPIVNNHNTVFVTAGIQPLLFDVRNKKISDTGKIYLSQPVIRTQFVNTITDGVSIAFINSTTAGFNISENEYKRLVLDWLDLFEELGISFKDINKYSKDYERIWGDLVVSGEKTFYYYNGIELGDSTFFTSIKQNGQEIGIETMSDLGFGLERLRWCVNNNNYYDLYSDSTELLPSVKAYLSALALLNVNNINPSNKNSGYRVRLFSKKLVNILNGRELNELELNYLKECIIYWSEWQGKSQNNNIDLIEKEYIRNCNRYIIDELIKEGYDNLSGININVSKEELKKRLLSSNVELEKVRKIMK